VIEFQRQQTKVFSMNAHTNLANLRPPIARYTFSVEEFHKLAEAGVLGRDARVELIEGELIKMSPIGSPHAGVVEQLVYFFQKHVGNYLVRTQNPIVLGGHSEPEPDVVLVRPRQDFYKKSHPRSADILLIVEVADTTIDYDRKVKLPLYAEHGIPEAWLIDLTAKQLEIHLDPSADSYRQILKPARDAIVAPSLAPEAKLDLAELLAD
jgi:Uma2 family endonuclease